MPECNFCKNEFETNSSLNFHKKSAKYCLILQKEQGIESEQKVYQCPKCPYNCIIRGNYSLHVIKCNNRAKSLNLLLHENKDINENLNKTNIELIIRIDQYKIELAILEEKISGFESTIKTIKMDHQEAISELKNELALERDAKIKILKEYAIR